MLLEPSREPRQDLLRQLFQRLLPLLVLSPLEPHLETLEALFETPRRTEVDGGIPVVIPRVATSTNTDEGARQLIDPPVVPGAFSTPTVGVPAEPFTVLAGEPNDLVRILFDKPNEAARPTEQQVDVDRVLVRAPRGVEHDIVGHGARHFLREGDATATTLVAHEHVFTRRPFGRTSGKKLATVVILHRSTSYKCDKGLSHNVQILSRGILRNIFLLNFYPKK